MTSSSKSRSPKARAAITKAANALAKVKQSPLYNRHEHQDDIYLNESSVYSQSLRNTTNKTTMPNGLSPFRQSALSMSLSQSRSRSRSASQNSRSQTTSPAPIHIYRQSIPASNNNATVTDNANKSVSFYGGKHSAVANLREERSSPLRPRVKP